jgi:uroporphyrinogen decarboxylase
LNHEEPDRAPLFFGSSGVTSILGPGYEKLKAHLGIQCGPVRWFAKQFQYVWPDEEVMFRLGSDARTVVPGPAESILRRDVSEDNMVDDWGISWSRAPGSMYIEMGPAPLRSATIDDLDRYPWPNLAPAGRFDGMAKRAKAIQDAGYASVSLAGISMFEQACGLRGIDVLLMDMAADEEFFTALMSKIKEMMIGCAVELLREAGPYIDVFVVADDLGMTGGPMMSPASYRRLIKPHQAELYAAIKQHTSAKIFLHSCGNIYPLLGDLAEIGVDLINPVQVSAGPMGDTARLKREFGDRLSFCGGIDTQRVMPHGTTDDVREEVRRRIRDLAPGGGYVAAAVHCIQPDVPPENIVAMCDEVCNGQR